MLLESDPNAMSREVKRAALVEALKDRTPEMDRRLAELKQAGRAHLRRDDFVWHHLLLSMATMGNSRGARGLIDDTSNYEQVTFEALAPLAEEARRERLDRVLRLAKVRMPGRKAEWLHENLRMIEDMGGPAEAKNKALAQSGKAAKIKFMRCFKGIGPKYGRNIWMDVYHPDFHEAIAVDKRIESISRLMGYDFEGYAAHEQFYLRIAEEADLQGWEVDRLIYNFRPRFEQAVSIAGRRGGARDGVA
jgi:hypothetical protein